MTVPADYERPHGGTVSLFVSRRSAIAPESLGPLFVNQGGPGAEAAIFGASVGGFTALDRFDVIGMDPRGTGRSTKLECTVDVRTLPSLDVDDTGELGRKSRRALDRFVDGCAGRPEPPAVRLEHRGARHGPDPRAPRRTAAELLRQVVRQRSRHRLPQSVPRAGARRGAGRRERPDARCGRLRRHSRRVRRSVRSIAISSTAVSTGAHGPRATTRRRRGTSSCAASQPTRFETATPVSSVDDGRLRDFQHEAWQLDDQSMDAAIDALGARRRPECVRLTLTR